MYTIKKLNLNRKKLGLFAAILFSIGSILGGGIFSLTGIIIKISGYYSILGLFVAFLIILISAFSYSRLVSFYPYDGGGYLFAKEILGNFWGFISGWGVYISACIFIAFVLHVFGLYFSEFFLNSIIPQIYLSLLAFLILIVLAFLNFSESGWFEGGLVIINILIILIFILLGIVFYHAGFIEKLKYNHSSDIIAAIGVIFVSFMGFQSLANISQEVKNPQKVIPKAIVISLSFVLIIYILLTVVVLSTLNSGFGVSSVVFSAKKVLGNFFLLIPFAAVVSTLSAANSNIIAAQKTIQYMAKEKQISNKFSRENKKGVPFVALIFLSIVVILFLIFTNIVFLVQVASFLVMFLFILINISSFILSIRKNRGDLKIIELLPLLGVVFTIFVAFYLPLLAFEVALILLFIGVMYYELEKRSIMHSIVNFFRVRNAR